MSEEWVFKYKDICKKDIAFKQGLSFFAFNLIRSTLILIKALLKEGTNSLSGVFSFFPFNSSLLELRLSKWGNS